MTTEFISAPALQMCAFSTGQNADDPANKKHIERREKYRLLIMRKGLHWIFSTVVLAAGLSFTVINCAHAADDPNSVKSPAETAPAGDQSLVGYWRFDEGSGDAVKDSSKSGNAGVISGAKWTKGVFGNALKFNGVNDYANIRCPGNGLIDKAVTVEAWIQSTGNNVNANLVFAGPESLDFGIWIQGGRYFAGIWNSEGAQHSATSQNSPTLDQWYHVAMTCDLAADKVIKFYINGKLNCSTTATGTAIKSGHTSIDIGGRTPNASYFNGLIDEVKIYSRALSEDEIRKTYDDYLEKRAKEINTAGYKNSPWIWTGNPEHKTAYFRKSFTAPDTTGKKVFMVCDGDNYQVFLNGKAIVPGKDYSEPQIVDITGELVAGQNVIAAQATNKSSNTGFFTYIGYPSKESPDGYEMVANGESMKCSAQYVKDWHSRDFDDSKWTQSQKVSGFNSSLAIKRNFPDLELYST
ncbi:MAG: LamG-like jellyroll fold domain-containing protein, partial [Deltaproteobacteria bacterium]